MWQALRTVSILGQRPDRTGSGILVRELWKCGAKRGDKQRLICAGYKDDNWIDQFGEGCSVVTFTGREGDGKIPFPVPGMSDVMPYESMRYRDLSPQQLQQVLGIYKKRVAHLISTFSPDLVHLHHLWVLVGLARAFEGVPFVVTVHGTGLKLAESAIVHRKIVAEGIEKIKHFFCVSRDIADDAAREYGIPSGKMSVLGNGYNESRFCVDGDVKGLSGKIVLCVGKFVAWKGFKYAIRACGRVTVEHRLVILGTGPMEEGAALVREAQDNRIKISFPGHVSHSEVAKWMRRAEVFVLSSIREPFGMALLEAMACGCRVVASASGGPRDLVHDVLVSQGFATLVDPLDEGDSRDEERYVNDLANGIQFQLGFKADRQARRVVASTVADRTWSAVYGQMRSGYEKVVRRV